MQQPQQPTGGQAQFQQGQAQLQQGGQLMGQRLQDVETPQQRAAVDAITHAIQVCEWCADQCVQLGDPKMAECIRLCEDVSELGESAITMIPRNSRQVQGQLRTLEQALQACARECGQHSHAHCQECAEVLPQVAQAIQQYAGTGRQVQ